MHLLSRLRSAVPTEAVYSYFELINPHRELIRVAFAEQVLHTYEGHLFSTINHAVRYSPTWEVLRECCGGIPVWEEFGGGPIWQPLDPLLSVYL